MTFIQKIDEDACAGIYLWSAEGQFYSFQEFSIAHSGMKMTLVLFEFMDSVSRSVQAKGSNKQDMFCPSVYNL